MVGLGRVELPTSPLSGVRSNQLSYRPSLATSAGRSPAGHQGARPRARRLSLSSFKKGFRGQRLNMLGSYAAHDYHESIDQAKKACITIPAHSVRNGACGFDDNPYPASDRFTSEALRIRGKDINATSSLLERR